MRPQLRSLGYVSHFDRSMVDLGKLCSRLHQFIAVVGVYTIFTTTFAAGRPADVVDLPVCRHGPDLVCLIFGEVAFAVFPSPRHLSLVPAAVWQALGVAALWVCLGFVLAVPDVNAVMSGEDKDPVVTGVENRHGRSGLETDPGVVYLKTIRSWIPCATSRASKAVGRELKFPN